MPVTEEAFNLATARTLLRDVFASWVQDLQLSVDRIDAPTDSRGAGAALRMAFSDRLCRDGGVICGQALMALADTAMVFAVSSASGRYRPMTTVDQTTHFLKPAAMPTFWPKRGSSASARPWRSVR